MRNHYLTFDEVTDFKTEDAAALLERLRAAGFPLQFAPRATLIIPPPKALPKTWRSDALQATKPAVRWAFAEAIKDLK